MDIRLDGKIALVTGASAGIGQGIAIGLAEAGADVVVNYRADSSLEGAEATKAGIEATGRRALLIRADMTDPGAIGQMFAQTFDELGGIDILVNNAGVGGKGSGVDQPLDVWNEVLAVNLTAPFLCIQHAVAKMREQGRGGRIVNITSVHEEAPGGGGPAYTASKGGLRNLTRSLALELAPEDIRIVNVAPGMILTKMNAAASNDPQVLQDAERQIPARRAGTPEDIANTVVFLVSDQASYVTGSSVFVDGGWMLEWPNV
jgi:glucose 1-dehydrogenase